MKNAFVGFFSLAAFCLLLDPCTTRAITAYTISDDGASLLRFDTATPASVTTVGAFSGSSTSIDGIDFLVSDGLLYGYSQTDNQLVRIDPLTAVTTFVSTPGTASTTISLGIDFNPTVNRLRLVNGDRQNLRITVATGFTDVDGTLTYDPGDTNGAFLPNIFEAAYTNNDVDPGTGTTVYYIDPTFDTLVTTNNPTGGVLNTVGSLTVDTTGFVGFDISTDGGVNTAYAILTPDGVDLSGLYTVNLSTGAATLVGSLGVQTYGLAIAPVPEPSTLAVSLLGFCILGARRRRSSRV